MGWSMDGRSDIRRGMAPGAVLRLLCFTVLLTGCDIEESGSRRLADDPFCSDGEACSAELAAPGLSGPRASQRSFASLEGGAGREGDLDIERFHIRLLDAHGDAGRGASLVLDLQDRPH